MAKLRLMSNNIWWAENNSSKWEARGEDCSAQHRAKGFARVYDETAPDIIGIQEAGGTLPSRVMTALLKQSQIPYALLWGKDTPIIYRADKFELIDSNYYIYPEEVPNLEGSFNNVETKSYCIGVFRVKENGKLIIFGTTHLWYMLDSMQAGSEAARVYQLGIFMDKIEEFKQKWGCPAVIVGDFNAKYNSDTVQSALKRGYIHAYNLATDYKDETSGYHLCNGDRYEGFENKGSFNDSIDQFLFKNIPDGTVKRFDRFYPEYYYPLSDHFPIMVDIEY
jgi:endonuclease/exonuclease/phosphatase family metal-dependent hydrolase